MQMGPFIDSDHPEIKKGAVDKSFQDIFLFEILRKLQDFTQYLGHNVRVILIPSVRDAHHDFVFPQVCNSSFRARLVLSNLQL
jgi:DNA polymerase alpha subunit B